MKKKKVFIVLIFFLFISFLFFIKYNVDHNTDLFFKYKQKIPRDLRVKIRKNIRKINRFYIYKKDSFSFQKNKKIVLNKNITGDELILYNNSNLNFTGPRAYFASNKTNLFLITGTGILMTLPLNELSTKKNNLKFKTISTNLNLFFLEYKKNNSIYERTSMVKSILKKNDSLLVSIVQKFSDNCYKHVILQGKINYKQILFKDFYKINKCRPFYSDYVGGSLADYKNDKILYTVGDWSICENPAWFKNKPAGFCTQNSAQNMESTLGKIFEINIFNKTSNIVSIGHDNPQGILYDKLNDIIFSAEHGPQGGDEINVNVNPSIKNVKNFGHPISSYGEHYGYPNKDILYKYKEAPFYKSHKKYNFEEPLEFYVPSIGISDIEKFDNKLLVASMGSDSAEGDLSFYIYTLNKKNKIKKKTIHVINQRIRDIHILKNLVLLYFESNGTIAIYNLKNLTT